MGMGNQLLPGNWHNYQPLTLEYTWPKVVKPSQTDWNTWDLAIATTFKAGCNQQLPYQLGNYFQLGSQGWHTTQWNKPFGSSAASNGIAMEIFPPDREPRCFIDKGKVVPHQTH